MSSLFLLFCTSLFAATSQPNSLPVRAIHSKDLPKEELALIQRKLGLVIGEKINLTRLGQGIEQLYQEERVDGLWVWVERSKGGLEVTLEGVVRRKIHQVLVDAGDLEGVPVPWKEAGSFDPRLVHKFQKEVQDAWALRGFFNCRVSVTANENRDKSVDVYVKVERGKQASVGQVKIVGVDNQDLRLIQDQLGLQTGDLYSRAILEQHVDKVNQYFRLNRYLTSRVQETQVNVRDGGETVDLRIVVQMLEQFRFQFAGNVTLSAEELRQLITPERLSEIDGFQKIASDLQEKYTQLGFSDCVVNVQVDRESRGKATTVYFRIEEGKRARVVRLVFLSKAPPPPELEDYFFEAAPGVLVRRIFWERGMREAAQNFRKRLQQEGYLSSIVGVPKAVFSEDRKEVEIFLDLDLGVQTLVRSIHWQGDLLAPEAELAKIFGIRLEKPLNLEEVEGARKRIELWYSSQGYPESKISGPNRAELFTLDAVTKQADFDIHIQKGGLYRIGEIRIEGNRKTSRKFLEREMGLRSGEIFDGARLAQAEEDLAVTGLFSRVEVTAQPGAEPLTKDVSVRLLETKAGLGELGFGAAYEDPRLRLRGFFGLAYQNLFGMNQTASLRNQVSLPVTGRPIFPYLEYASVLSYRAPHLLDIPWVVSGQLGVERYEASPIAPTVFSRARIDGKVEKKWTKPFSTYFRFYHFEASTTEVGLGDTKTTTSEFIGSVGPGLSLDWRNDPFNPERGSLHLLDFEFAHPALLSQEGISFVMGTMRNSFYIPLFKPFRMAIYVGGGYARALIENRALPSARLVNNLSLGGQTTLRGFTFRQFIPPSTSNDAAYANARAEFSWNLVQDLSMAVFVDSGQIFSNIWASGPAFSDTRHDGAGIGLRYKTPVGPLVVDLAQGLGADRADLRFYFTVGSL